MTCAFCGEREATGVSDLDGVAFAACDPCCAPVEPSTPPPVERTCLGEDCGRRFMSYAGARLCNHCGGNTTDRHHQRERQRVASAGA